MYNYCVMEVLSTHRPEVDLAQFLLVVDKQWIAHCRQMVCNQHTGGVGDHSN